ncbi:MAG: guanylate kinase [Eggerthellaceae bacterium]|nr:guanylate kinase [Eggerthellaceae bacterium]
MQRRGNLFVISGPSGAGKGTLVARVLERVENAWVSVSATTRQPRPGEVDGVHYFFLSDDQFSELVEQDGFLEWAQVFSNRYGTPVAKVQERMAQGCQVILEIDVQGAFQVKEKMPQAHLVFIDPPSYEVLEARLRGRGTETDDVIAQRLETALLELSQKDKYDYVLVNDNLEAAADELVAYIEEQARRN